MEFVLACRGAAFLDDSLKVGGLSADASLAPLAISDARIHQSFQVSSRQLQRCRAHFRGPVLTDVRIIEPERYADGRSRSERRFWSTQGVSSLTVYKGLSILSSCIDSRSGPYIVKPGREKPSLAHLPSDNPDP